MRNITERVFDRIMASALHDFDPAPNASIPRSISSSSSDFNTTSNSDLGHDDAAHIAQPELAHIADEKPARITTRALSRRARPPTLLTRLMALPPELQLEILSFLPFGDIERLRRTCRLFRVGIPKPMIRSLLPDLKAALLSTCYECLSQDTARARLIGADDGDARFPLANRCFKCVAKKGEFFVGRKYILADHSTIWVCRLCGLPVMTAAAWNQPEFHRKCYRRYSQILFLYFLAGVLQWCMVLIAAVLCWHFFKKDVLVLAPTIVSCFWRNFIT